jgi:hypothetical protein
MDRIHYAGDSILTGTRDTQELRRYGITRRGAALEPDGDDPDWSDDPI